MTEYAVTEGVAGYWHYHLSEKGKEYRSLCGRPTMRTSIPLHRFGLWQAAPDSAMIKGRWCEACQKIEKSQP